MASGNIGTSSGSRDGDRRIGSPNIGEALAMFQRQVEKSFRRAEGKLDLFVHNNTANDQHSVDRRPRTPDGNLHRGLPADGNLAVPKHEHFAYAEGFERRYDDNIQPYEWERHGQGRGQREFKSRCTIKGKLFDVIIDSGCCENLVSKAIVRELGLGTETLPNPYNIRWIKTRKEIKVMERCRVPFSIGKYVDEMFFDVIEMDPRGLIFGHPWQFDVAARHDKNTNEYRIKKDGVRFVLTPSKSSRRAANKKKGDNEVLTIVNSEAEVHHDFKEVQEIRDVMGKQILVVKEEESIIVPEDARLLLVKIQDHMPRDLPDVLSPIRGTLNQINCIKNENIDPYVPSYPDDTQSSRSSFFKERVNDGGKTNNIRTRGRGDTRWRKKRVRRRKRGRKRKRRTPQRPGAKAWTNLRLGAGHRGRAPKRRPPCAKA